MSSPSIPLIPEILRLICEAAAPSKRSLASLARTCSAFEKPALDVLWSSLNQFLHLVKCLPSDLWEINGPGSKRVLYLKHPLLLGDCKRFLEYAKRVKQLSFVPMYGTTIAHLTTYPTLQAVIPGPIFPNLRHLRFDGSDYDYHMSFMPMFLGPHLKSIHLYCYDGGIPQMALVPGTLCNNYPTLEDFSLEWSVIRHGLSQHGERRSLDVVGNALHQWKNLVKLKVSNLSYSALLELSQSTNLASLNICRWEPDSTSSRPPRKGGFRSLTELELGANSALHCIQLLQVMDSSPIQKVTINFTDGQTSADWRDLTLAIRNSVNHDTLRSLSVCDEVEVDNEGFTSLGEQVEFDGIEALLVFRNLENLFLGVPQGFYFSDPKQTKEMARSWTNISRLHFSIRGGRQCPRKSTIKLIDLLPFAEHCPRLCSLSIFVDGTSPPAIKDETPANGIRHTKLIMLGVNDSLAAPCHSDRIAVFLSSVFPSLAVIETMDNDFGDDDETDEATKEIEEAWSKASDLLRILNTVRKQEKEYYTSKP